MLMVLGFSTEAESTGDVGYNRICYKELVHAIMEVDKSKVRRVNWQMRDPGKLIF